MKRSLMTKILEMEWVFWRQKKKAEGRNGMHMRMGMVNQDWAYLVIEYGWRRWG